MATTTVIVVSTIEPDATPLIFTTRKEMGREEAVYYTAQYMVGNGDYPTVEQAMARNKFHITHRGPITKW